jgi:SAM-dependent methyltransferase
MQYITRASSLYQFLWHCNESDLEKTVLDCGAAGQFPPLAIFYENGYETHGIDVSMKRIKLSGEFEKKYDMNLNIRYGDMRDLDFEEDAFSFLYSYNSIFHLTKSDTVLAMDEFKRVVKRGGLFFVNFLSTDDFMFGMGEDIGNHQFQQEEHGELAVHSFYEDDEPDELFNGCRIVRKEKRIVNREYEGEIIRQAFIDYIIEMRK